MITRLASNFVATCLYINTADETKQLEIVWSLVSRTYCCIGAGRRHRALHHSSDGNIIPQHTKLPKVEVSCYFVGELATDSCRASPPPATAMISLGHLIRLTSTRDMRTTVQRTTFQNSDASDIKTRKKRKPFQHRS